MGTMNITGRSLPFGFPGRTLPVGLIASVNGALQGNSTLTMSIQASKNVAIGYYLLTLELHVDSSTVQKTEVMLIVLAASSEFWISADPNSLVISQGSTGKSTITVPTLPLTDMVTGPMIDKWFLYSNVTKAGTSPQIMVSPIFAVPSTFEVANSTLTVTVGHDVPIGNYTIGVIATWYAKSPFNQTETVLIPLAVVAPRCIIATATYGSELSPEVQLLRDFRDKIQRTFVGSQFMLAFNSWYYSFSPRIAAWIAVSETARSLMRAVLYPLIGALTISSSIFDLFSFNTEIGILVAGISASSLLGVIYLTLPIIIVLRVAKRRMNCKALISILGVGLALALFGTLSNGTLRLAEILTSVVVMETMLLAPSILTKGILGKVGQW
jgi:hypothetical protein